MKKQKISKLPVVLSSLITICSCSNLIEVPPPQNQLEAEIVFSDSSSAVTALTSVYSYFSTSVHGASKHLALYVDDYVYTSSSTPILEFSQSKLSVNNSNNESLWSNLFFIIYQCNSILENIDSESTISLLFKQRLTSEAKFLRAYAYFYLINLYENIPLILTTDVSENSVVRQSEPQLVYEQITKDLLDAKKGLAEEYDGNDKVRANRWAAAALLSRVYLFQEQWQLAEQQASEIINSKIYSLTSSLDEVFLANSKEAILQFWTQNGYISDAAQIIPSSSSNIPTYTLNPALYEAFDISDKRRASWINTNTIISGDETASYHYLFKYKNRTNNTTKTEYLMALRLSEQYLTRAEARAHQNNLIGALDDINTIRTRAGLSIFQSSGAIAEYLEEIIHERRLEFFGEWGHRFMDLKRIGKLDEIIGSTKSTWRNGLSDVFPIPQNEIIYNRNLRQNNGY